jgi:hypothetical protein
MVTIMRSIENVRAIYMRTDDEETFKVITSDDLNLTFLYETYKLIMRDMLVWEE